MQPHGRHHRGPLLLRVQFCRKGFDLVVERLLLFRVHLAQDRRHQVADDAIRLIGAAAEHLNQTFQRRLPAHLTQHPGSVQLPDAGSARQALQQRLHRRLAGAAQRSHRAVLHVLIPVVEHFNELCDIVFRLHLFEVTQRIVLQHRIRTIEERPDRFDDRGVVHFKRAQNQQCSAALLDRALFDQSQNIL